MNIKNMTLGQKIAAGYTLLLGITIGLGLMALWNMWSGANRASALSAQYLPEAELAANLEGLTQTAYLNTRSYALTGDKIYLDRFNECVVKMKAELGSARKLADEYPSLTKLKEEVTVLENKLALYIKGVDATEININARAKAWETMTANATSFHSSLDEMLKTQNQLLREEINNNAGSAKLQEQLQKVTLLNAIAEDISQVRIGALKSQSQRNPTLMRDAQRYFENAAQRFSQLEPLVRDAETRQQLITIRSNVTAYKEASSTLLKAYQEIEAIDKARAGAADDLMSATNAIMDAGFQRTASTARSSSSNLSTASGALMIGLVVSILAGAILSFLITRGITATVRAIIQSLSTSSEQTASAAVEISHASQSLAESSSEQAASLEETSASLEEMAGMTKLNADNAAKAKNLADQTRGAADSGADDMRAMSLAMDEIKSASDGISKIIKTIDEIAFQTNILALNAAVEAARAGEAGMGFAVVADEVRNLAQRSAQAAKETAQRIEESISKSEHGVQISAKVAASLQQIVSKAREVDELVAEIATASKEQSKGIDQVNIAVSQMDKVTQSNAANAEQTASASEELSAQSIELQSAVHELLSMVGGHAAPARAALPAPSAPAATSPAASRKLNTDLTTTRTKSAPSTDKKTSKRLDREHAIPLDRDFKNI
ncbi:MAG: hypothetical protein B9S32_17955 [Verrucomicrobia bacterium Tous-C9LFEB]|nr:MAG: hypothetical protein B9S32_17955 [Verrucomicrobia bacterium Tous-C9LFEB]